MAFNVFLLERLNLKMTDIEKKIMMHILNNPVSIILAEYMSEYRTELLKIAYYLLLRSITPKRIIIISTKKEIELNWVPVIHRIQKYQKIKIAVALGKKKRKKEALYRKNIIVFTNEESVDWIKEICLSEEDLIIIDGLSRFINRNSKRYKEVKELVNRVNHVLAVIHQLIPNELSDIWDEIYFLDNGKRLGLTKSAFLDRYFFAISERKGSYLKKKYIPKDNAINSILKAIEDIYLDGSKLRVFSGQATYIKEYVELSKSEISRYNLIKLQGLPESYLLQLASGSIYENESKRKTYVFHNRKIIKIKYLLNNFKDKKVLIVYSYKHEKDLIMSHIPISMPLDNKFTIENWNKGQIQIGLINSSTCRKKSDPIKGCDIVIWYSLIFSKRIYEKINERILNKADALVIYLVTADTIDEKAVQVIMNE
ncbi:MAG: hypothetical protein IKS56_03775 [Lachnospiraceae bacterium]|nr:hypothetical protein [Lachnospiraceae bacterium]